MRPSRCPLATVFVLLLGTAASAQPLDFKKILGSDAKAANCASCHAKETAAWSQTHHARTLDQLKTGRVIADKLGLGATYLKSGSCIDCHATAKGDDAAKLEIISAVSCESCHGAAGDWLKPHADFGEGKTKETETPEHKADRIKKADLAGMIRKDRVYQIARNCFACHVVPDERLVNDGGHRVASDFELVAWSQGEVKHNYLNSEVNRDASPERKRVLYVVGKLVDLEVSLSAAGKIGQLGHYRSAVLNRVRNVTAAIDEMLTLQEIPEVSNVLKDFQRRADGSLILTPEMLKEAPAKIGAAARAIAESHDGSKLSGLDSLLPKPAQYKGRIQP